MRQHSDRMESQFEDALSADDTTSVTLIAKVKQADPRAWGRFVELYGPLVFHWCLRSGLSRADAEDVGQEVFLRVASSIHRFEKERPSDTLRGWLRVVTRRIVVDYYRKTNRMPPTFSMDIMPEALTDPNAPDDNSELDEEQRILYQRALALLHQDFSAVTVQAFMLSVVEGLPASDVASQLGISQNAVYIAKSRVLNRLRTDLADQ